MSRHFLLWLLLTLIACGLGYAAVTRYDPTLTGNSDATFYFAMIEGNASPELCDHRCMRVLVPSLARVIALPFRGVAPMIPLLAVSAMLSAGTALLLARLGRTPVAALLYLVQFPVVHAHLSGLVDAGEVFFVVLATVALIERKLVLLLIAAVLGALSKETYPIILGAMVVAFALTERRWPAAIGAVLLSAATLLVLHLVLAGSVVLPPHLRFTLTLAELPGGLWRCVSSREMLYVFVWLLPIGAWGARELPRAWRWGAAAGSLALLLVAALVDARGNAARHVFDACGPLLTVGAARWVAGMLIRRDS